MAEPWLPADNIAAHLGVTKDTVYTWIAEKALPAHTVGRLRKFQSSEIDDWVRAGEAASDDRDRSAAHANASGRSYDRDSGYGKGR
ncbi:helix-turn-helix domain-containing protein [Micrococcus luteus]|nr:helix-turn-helix domain-containing protein [Micrococcus luteus]